MNKDSNFDDLKKAETDFEILELFKKRWSPTAFSDRPVNKDDLRALLEAARWAPSSFNEQPWYYIVAERESSLEFEKLLSCLTEGNQKWARFVPVLAFGVVRTYFERNNKPNRHALHDLGAATFSMALEATARGLYVHQMAGIQPDKAHETYGVPDKYEVLTGIAIGYLGDGEKLPEKLYERNLVSRKRRKLNETVFMKKWGNTHRIFM